LRSGRFDYIVRFSKPDAGERAEIIRLCCRQLPLAADVDVADLARRTENLTGADLESLCKKAALVAIAEYQNGRRAAPFAVTRSDFEDQL
jgi:SpoVK/Ycf46/Vps4 family AAA+-type ATPase